MMKDSFILYTAQFSALSAVMTDNQLGSLMRLILAYIKGEEVAPSQDLLMAWALVKNQLDMDADKYRTTCERNRENARKRWDATACGGKRVDAKYADNDNDNETDTDNDVKKDVPKVTSKKSVSPAFVKPTIDEVRAYCMERRNSVDPEKFVAFYESNGWKVGKNPMKNWKGAVITWEGRTGSNNVNDMRNDY